MDTGTHQLFVLALYPIWDPSTGLKFQIKNQHSWLSVNAILALTLKG